MSTLLEQVTTAETIGTATSAEEYSTTSIGPPQYTQMFLIRTIVLSVMFVVSLIGNATIVGKLATRGLNRRGGGGGNGGDGSIKSRRSRGSNGGGGLGTIELLIAHLAASDLFVTFFCNVTDAIWVSTIQWYAGNVACKLVKYLQVFGLYSSTYITVVIAIDRCSAVLDPMRDRTVAHRRVVLMIAGSWLLSAVFSLPQLFIFHVSRGPFREDFYQCITHTTYTSARWHEQVYSTLSVLLMFILPLTTMIVSYTLIFCTVARKSRDFKLDSVNGLSRSCGKEYQHETEIQGGQVRVRLFRKAKIKSFRMTAMIVAAFIVCWTPYQVVHIIHTFSETISRVDTRYVQWIFCFGMANSMFNPLIYGAFHLCSWHRRRRSNSSTRDRYESFETMNTVSPARGPSLHRNHLTQSARAYGSARS